MGIGPNGCNQTQLIMRCCSFSMYSSYDRTASLAYAGWDYKCPAVCYSTVPRPISATRGLMERPHVCLGIWLLHVPGKGGKMYIGGSWSTASLESGPQAPSSNLHPQARRRAT